MTYSVRLHCEEDKNVDIQVRRDQIHQLIQALKGKEAFIDESSHNGVWVNTDYVRYATMQFVPEGSAPAATEPCCEAPPEA